MILLWLLVLKREPDEQALTGPRRNERFAINVNIKKHARICNLNPAARGANINSAKPTFHIFPYCYHLDAARNGFIFRCTVITPFRNRVFVREEP
jgi:hypothetical protein